MKTLRSVAGLLLILNGVLHVVEYTRTYETPGSIGILLFGILYAIVGILIFGKKLYPVYLGILIPLIGMTLSIAKFGVPDFFSLSALFKLIGLIVIACCIYVLVKRN